jgi:glycosyltransferase involved in cell wall biosynthesis
MVTWPVLDKENVLVIVPAFNEQESLPKVLKTLISHDYQVLVSDDGSIDRTRTVAQNAGAIVLSLPFNLGVGGALRAGFKFAVRNGFSAVIQVDADGQHDISQIERLIEEVNRSGVHMVVGSRFGEFEDSMSVSLLRRLMMRVLASIATHATGTKITDSTSGFRIIREPLLSEFARTFPVYYLGDTFEALTSAGKAGYLIREIPTVIHERTHGESSATIGQSIKFIIKSIAIAMLNINLRISKLQDSDRQ